MHLFLILLLGLILGQGNATAAPSRVHSEKPLPFEDFIRKADSVYVAFSPGAAYMESGTCVYNSAATVPAQATEEHKGKLIELFTNHSSYPSGNVSGCEGPGVDHLIFEFRRGDERLTMTCGWMSFVVTYHRVRGTDRRLYRTYTGWLTPKATSQLKQWRVEYSEDKVPVSEHPAKAF